jgi:VanZ family protein
MNKLKRFAPAIAWGILVFILSATPGKDLPSLNFGALMIDKIGHFIFYSVFSWLLLRGGIARRYWFWVAAVSASYGMMMEFYQEFFCIDRTFDWGDEAANAFGAFVGAWLFLRFSKNDFFKI